MNWRDRRGIRRCWEVTWAGVSWKGAGGGGVLGYWGWGLRSFCCWRECRPPLPGLLLNRYRNALTPLYIKYKLHKHDSHDTDYHLQSFFNLLQPSLLLPPLVVFILLLPHPNNNGHCHRRQRGHHRRQQPCKHHLKSQIARIHRSIHNRLQSLTPDLNLPAT
jgi:hypothetical protein